MPEQASRLKEPFEIPSSTKSINEIKYNSHLFQLDSNVGFLVVLL